MAHVYHWKHGWIPLDHEAALKKAKGNHSAAARMIGDAHGAGAGIHTRRDVAGAIKDLPNVPHKDQRAAKQHVAESAQRIGAHDLLPDSIKSSTAPTDTGGSIHKADAAARMYGVGSPQHRAAQAKFGTGTADHTARVKQELHEVDSIAADVVSAYHGLIPHDELHELVMEVIDGSPAHKAATRAQYLAAAKAAVNKAVAAKARK